MITLYSTHCPKCKVIEMKLKQLGEEFIVIDDEAKVIEYAKEHGIIQAPLLDVDGKTFDFQAAVKYINERK